MRRTSKIKRIHSGTPSLLVRFGSFSNNEFACEWTDEVPPWGTTSIKSTGKCIAHTVSIVFCVEAYIYAARERESSSHNDEMRKERRRGMHSRDDGKGDRRKIPVEQSASGVPRTINLIRRESAQLKRESAFIVWDAKWMVVTLFDIWLKSVFLRTRQGNMLSTQSLSLNKLTYPKGFYKMRSENSITLLFHWINLFFKV